MTTKSHRQVDNNGYLTVLSTPVSSFGIFDYAAWQVGLDGDPDRIVKVFRPETAITDPEAISSFQIVPLIDEHDLLSGFEDDEDVMSPEDKGIDGVMSNVVYRKPWLLADLKVFTRRMQRAIDSGKVELSLGYTCDFVVKSGTFEGQPFEVMQINLRGNHIALVEAARVEGARVLDSKIAFDCLSFVRTKPNGNETMKRNGVKRGRRVAMDNAVQQLKALLPALEQFLNEEASEPQHQEGAATAQPGTTEQSGAAPAPGTEAPEGDEGEETLEGDEGEEGDDDVATLVTQIKTLLEKIASSAAAPAGDEGEENTGEENVGDEGEENEEIGDDRIDSTAAGDCEGNGRASQGPAAGKHAAGDSRTRKPAMDAATLRKTIYKDMAEKQKLYDRVSPVIGAFDHSLMTCEEMAGYAAKKLKLTAPKGMASVALDSYLSGHERTKAARKEVTNQSVGDSAFGEFDPIDNYLNGAK